MSTNQPKSKSRVPNDALPPIEVRTLRAFANAIARVCCALRLIEFDIVCRFVPRERPEYASVEARFRDGAKVVKAEDVMLAPMVDDIVDSATSPSEPTP